MSDDLLDTLATCWLEAEVELLGLRAREYRYLLLPEAYALMAAACFIVGLSWTITG